MTLSDWLDARDGETLARAWAALEARPVTVGAPNWTITPHGAAQLAAAFLGWPIERVAWLGLPVESMPAPIFETSRTTPRCFLEHDIDVREDCLEWWKVRELREGQRGVQHVAVEWGIPGETREGGEGGRATVVRVFDCTTGTAASIFIGSRTIATIGELDVGALDLFFHYGGVTLPSWTQYDRDGVRGLVAQLAAEIDAHFDVSTTWPERTAEPADGGNTRRLVFESGPRSIELFERRFTYDRDTSVTVHGLPWGHQLELFITYAAHGTFASASLRLPLASGQAVLARLLRVPGVVQT